MIIRIWYQYIVFSFFVIPCFEAKPFSLNKAIAAEELQKLSQSTARTNLTSETPEKFILTKSTKSNPLKSKKLKAIEYILPRGKTLSSLKYRKTFQIRSPLKPKKLKYLQRPWNKRKNKSIKRQIHRDEKYHRKYIPLLRSLSMLFDNIAKGSSDDSVEIKRNKYRKYRNTSKKNSTVCSCNNKSHTDDKESKQEAIVPTTPPLEVSTDTEPVATETSATATYHTTTSDVRSLRPNPDISLLLTRNTASPRGDDIGFSERSRPAFHPSTEGDITRDHRDSEHNTGSGQNWPHAENNEENTYSTPRDSTSSRGFGGRLRGDGISSPSPVYRGGIDKTEFFTQSEKFLGRTGGELNRFEEQNKFEVGRNESESSGPLQHSPNPVYRGGVNETNFSTESEKLVGHTRGDLYEFEGQNKLEVGRNESEGSEFLQQFVRGDRRHIPEYNIDNDAESLQPQEGNKKGINSVALDISYDKRLTDRSSAPTKEDQKAGPKVAAVTSFIDLNNPITMLQNSRKHNAPFVTIIDGYSVARDKNGANKLAEQSIRFHS